MNCRKIQNRLINEDLPRSPLSTGDQAHFKTCKACDRMYNLDIGLDQRIGSALETEEIPESLPKRIEMNLDHTPLPKNLSSLRISAAVAVSLLIFAAGYLFFSTTPFRYDNIQQLSENAVEAHIRGNTRMSFSASEIDRAVPMLSRELKFNVIIPNLEEQGYFLLGGRLCILGKCRIAYLFYEKHNKISSLAILDYGHLDFEMSDGSRFQNEIKGYRTDIWKTHGQVYAMVY